MERRKKAPAGKARSKKITVLQGWRFPRTSVELRHFKRWVTIALDDGQLAYRDVEAAMHFAKGIFALYSEEERKYHSDPHISELSPAANDVNCEPSVPEQIQTNARTGQNCGGAPLQIVLPAAARTHTEESALRRASTASPQVDERNKLRVARIWNTAENDDTYLALKNVLDDRYRLTVAISTIMSYENRRMARQSTRQNNSSEAQGLEGQIKMYVLERDDTKRESLKQQLLKTLTVLVTCRRSLALDLYKDFGYWDQTLE